MFLAASVFFAIQDAIRAARKENGETEAFSMDSPATCERIRMACSDHLTKQVSLLYSVIGLILMSSCFRLLLQVIQILKNYGILRHSKHL